MRYVDKIMLEKPYPVLCSTKDLSLYLQLGTAVFQNDQVAADRAGSAFSVSNHPIVVPVNIRDHIDDVYCSVDTSGELSPLCMQGDTLPVSAFNRLLFDASSGLYEDDLDFSSLSKYFRRNNVNIDLTVSKERDINLVLDFRQPRGGGKCFWQTFYYIDDPVYLWSTAESTDGIVIDLIRRALAYAIVFWFRHDGFLPRFSFTAPDDASEEVKRQVEEINRLFHYGYMLCWERKHINGAITGSILKHWADALDSGEGNSFSLPRVYYGNDYYTPELLRDFLEGMSYFKFSFGFKGTPDYYGIIPHESGLDYDIVVFPDQLLKENKEILESPLRKYIKDIKKL